MEEGLASSLLDALEQPYELTLTILDMRAYARTKDAVDNAQKQDDVPDSPYTELVGQFYKEAIDKARAVNSGR